MASQGSLIEALIRRPHSSAPKIPLCIFGWPAMCTGNELPPEDVTFCTRALLKSPEGVIPQQRDGTDARQVSYEGGTGGQQLAGSCHRSLRAPLSACPGIGAMLV
eukprot:1189188-Karenia_brevis.AAC.1